MKECSPKNKFRDPYRSRSKKKKVKTKEDTSNKQFIFYVHSIFNGRVQITLLNLIEQNSPAQYSTLETRV